MAKKKPRKKAMRRAIGGRAGLAFGAKEKEAAMPPNDKKITKAMKEAIEENGSLLLGELLDEVVSRLKGSGLTVTEIGKAVIIAAGKRPFRQTNGEVFLA